MWCDLNAWVMAQWAQDTTQSEESIFRRYASERLGLEGKNIDHFRQLALLSADAVIRGRNSTHRDMNPWWTRDQGISWPKILGDRERNLKQKDASIAIWREIVKLAETIEWPDAKTHDQAIGSATYGLRLYEIYRNLIYLENAENSGDREGMQKWLQAYDDAWDVYNQLPGQFTQLATLYTRDFNRHINHRLAEIRVEAIRAELMESE